MYGEVVATYRANGAAVPEEWLNRIKSESSDRNTTVGGLKAGQLVSGLRLMMNSEGFPDVDQLRRRTLFGFYERGLSEPLAQRWATQLLTEGSTRTLSFHRRTSFATRRSLKWCPICAASDLEEGRQSAWHTLHQVPYLFHCLVHREPLLSSCAHCGTPLDRGWHQCLPIDDCRACGGAKFVGHTAPLTPGYKGILDLATRIGQQSLHLRADAWTRVREALALKLGGDRALAAELRPEILSRWSAGGFEDISRALQLPRLGLDLDDVSAADHSPILVERLIWVDAMIARGLVSVDSFERSAKTAAVEEGVDSILRAEIGGSVKAAELPVGLGEDYLDGMGAKAICARHAVPMRRLSRWREALPEALRAKVEAVRFRNAQKKGNERKGKPIFREASPDQRLRTYKDILTELSKKHPAMSRSQLNKASQVPFRYVYLNEPAWLDIKFPKRTQRDTSATRELHRASAAAFFKSPGATRANFRRSNEAAEAWLMRRDAEWFKALVARSTKRE